MGDGRVRLSGDRRREQLLAAGSALLAERHFDEVSTTEIAAAAGVSRGLLYHYFPSKEDFLLAALRRGQREMAAAMMPNPALETTAQLRLSVDSYLDFVEAHEAAAVAVLRSRGAAGERVKEAVERSHERRLAAVIEWICSWRSGPVQVKRTARLEMAVQGWLFFTEGAVLRWLEWRAVRREELREMVMQALLDALRSANEGGVEMVQDYASGAARRT